MIIPSKFNGYNKDGTRNLFMGGGGGGGPTQTTSTVQNTNIPSYAQPYVESMLGATQKQLFNTSQVQTGTDDQGNPIMGTQLDSFKPYQAYGGTYDAQGNQLSYDPSKGIAKINPMQANAYNNVQGMQFDPTRYNLAQLGAEAAGRGGLSSAQDAMRYGKSGFESGARGQELGIAGGQSAIYDANRYAKSGFESGMAGQELGLAAAAKAQALADAQVGRANKFGDAGFASGQKGQELGIAGGKLGIEGGAKYGEMGAGFGKQAAGLADPALAYGAQGAGYGQTGAGYGAQAAQLANTALGYGQGSADIGQMALRAQGMGEDISGQSQALARQQAMAGQQYAQMATDPRVTQALMNPYTQNVLDVQNKELQRQADIAAQGRGAAAVRAGAFGGGRQAIENAEAQRNLETMKTANTAQALNQAYQQAQAQQQFGANLNLQGLAGAQQGLGTALSGGQLGLSGLGTALQGQQGALAGVGQAGAMYGLGMQGAQTGIQGTQAGLAGVNAANQAYQTGIQGAGMGLQGVNTQLAGVDRQLAGTAQGMQGAQVGLAGVNAATNAGQLGLQGAQVGLQGTAQGMQGAQTGLSGVDRALAGTQAQLAGTAQGMQGAQAGMQGVQGAQAGYGLTNQSASNLTSMLGQQQANQLGLANNQMAMGDKKMAYDQSILNQAVQDYANAQQYPLMQLGTMSNMLRGLPMQASTTNQYAASPSPLSQAVGTIGAGASIYNAMAPRGAAGGEVKGYAKGGIMSYDMGGEVESQLENMDEKGLQAQARESTSPSIRKMAQRLLRERQMSKQPQGTGPMGVQYQAAQPQMPSYAPGGIVAFKTGGGANEEGGEDEAMIGMQERLAQPAPTTGGIMGATAQPATPVPVVPQAGRAMQQAPDIPAFMKAQYADTEKRMNAPLSEFMAERKAAMQEAGVADAAEGQQQQRASLMAEKANMADEKDRQKYMRMAEFFASWGSTPGPVLVAGLNALQKTVPNIVADEKEQKKARREIDKSIADLDNATRLEKRGEVDAAMALKLKAAEDMKALNVKFIDYQSRRESDASSFAATKYNADMQFRSEQLRANTARLDRAARRETDADSKAFGQYQTAANQEQRLISKIADQAKMFEKDYATIKTAEMNAGANEGKMNPALVSGYEAAKKRIADQEAIWTKQKEQAARDTDLAYKRVRVNPEAAKDYAKPTSPAAAPAAAPSSGPISGEFSAPTAAHIAALQANPTQAAAFDAKFGPGAANEYLGK
jgi:hypothetical protein